MRVEICYIEYNLQNEFGLYVSETWKHKISFAIQMRDVKRRNAALFKQSLENGADAAHVLSLDNVASHFALMC